MLKFNSICIIEKTTLRFVVAKFQYSGRIPFRSVKGMIKTFSRNFNTLSAITNIVSVSYDAVKFLFQNCTDASSFCLDILLMFCMNEDCILEITIT